MARVCPDCGEEFAADVSVCPNDGAELERRPTVPSDSNDELIGSVVGENFRLESLLGQGGMGKVYRGTQLSVGRTVAVKLIRTGVLGGEEVERRFYREARVVSGFSHPNIVRLIDFGEDADLGLPYLAMEYIDGISLTALLSGRRFHPNLAAEIAAQVAAGLSDAHDAGIVHRDLKSENILLVPISPGRVQVKLIDFGLAYPGDAGKRLTRSGMIYGTPQYLSPQQARDSDVGPQSDVYSLGVILYEMLTGRLPFGGDTAFEIMVAHVQKSPPPLDEAVPGDRIPSGMVELVESMLEKDPAARPTGVSTVLDRIEEIRTAEEWSPVRLGTSDTVETGLERWMEPVEEEAPGIDSRSSGAGTTETPTSMEEGPKTAEHVDLSSEEAKAVAETLGLDSERAQSLQSERIPAGVREGMEVDETSSPSQEVAADPPREPAQGQSPSSRDAGESTLTGEATAELEGAGPGGLSDANERRMWLAVGLAFVLSGIGLGAGWFWLGENASESEPGEGDRSAEGVVSGKSADLAAGRGSEDASGGTPASASTQKQDGGADSGNRTQGADAEGADTEDGATTESKQDVGVSDEGSENRPNEVVDEERGGRESEGDRERPSGGEGRGERERIGGGRSAEEKRRRGRETGAASSAGADEPSKDQESTRGSESEESPSSDSKDVDREFEEQLDWVNPN